MISTKHASPEASVADCLLPDELEGFVQGWLDGEGRARVEAHIDRCPECRATLSELAKTSLVPSISGNTTSSYASAARAHDERRAPIFLVRGQVVGRYVIDSLLGQGAMGVVYAAYDPKLDRKVALKMMRPAAADGRPIDAARVEHEARVEREARAMAQLSHPNVAAVYDIDMHEGQLFIAMECIEGITLRSWLLDESRPLQKVLDAFIQAGRGLAAAHASGLVHRDFKPDNVLCDRRGHVYVTDFGLARAAAEGAFHPDSIDAETRGHLVGTPAYMSPEQLAGKKVDVRSDQFSFCVALYEAIYRQRPFAGNTWTERAAAVLAGRVQQPPRRKGVPARVYSVLARGLSADPDARFASMDALVAALQGRPNARRWRMAAAACIALTSVAVPLAYRHAKARSLAVCTGFEQRLTGVWDQDRRRAVREAFSATKKPFADDIWVRTERALDMYTHDWTSARTEACEAKSLRRESAIRVDSRNACLDDDLRKVRALTDVLARADADVVARAVSATESLPAVSACGDTQAWLARIEPPGDASKEKVDGIRDQLARVVALRAAGKYGEMGAVAGAALVAADQVGYRPIQAEVLFRYGLAQALLGRHADAEKALMRSITSADSVGDDVTRAQASSVLVYELGLVEGKYDLAEYFNEQTKAALARLGGDPVIDAKRRMDHGAVLAAQKKLDEAVREYEAAIPLLESASGTNALGLSVLFDRLGQAHIRRGEFDEAREALQRSVDISDRALGPRHPAVSAHLNSLGILLAIQMKFEEAVPYFERAAEIAQQSVGEQSTDYVIPLCNLALAANEEGDFTRAIAMFNRVLSILDRLEGANDSTKTSTMAGLGRAYFELGDRRRAAEYLERTVKAPIELESATDHAAAQVTLAKILWDAGGDRRQARKMVEEASATYREYGVGPLDARNAQAAEAWLRMHPSPS